ncbi:hypothetical protein GH714_018296 [Hevea brasiliensis]|uniref:Cytochrome P450 n=1 Tax=Hevea brasiliensis TaxID=3981 RepID=A0A6A6KUL5_HEVBR|nr:hypothetical protein GH714_018296 [Hevea brasiliensis]
MAIAECLQILAVFIFMLLLSHWIWNNAISPVTNWPVVGMLPGLLYKAPHIHQYATQLLKQSGGTFEFRGPWMIQSMIKDNKFQLFLERSMREKVTKGLIPVLQHVSRLGISVDLQDLFQRFTFDNICLLVLGFDPNSLSVDLPEVAYKTAFDDVEEAVFYRHIVPESIWKLQKWLNIGQEKKLSMATSIIDNFLEQCISSKKEEVRRRNKAQKLQVQEKEEEDYDLITACIEEEEMDDEETKSSKNSDKYLRDIGFNFIAAGKDTVNAALTWFSG